MQTGRRLILADDTVLENSEAGYAEGVLWCFLKNVTFQQAATLFLDAEKTDTIRFEYGEKTDTYEHYTDCISISAVDNDRINVALKEVGN